MASFRKLDNITLIWRPGSDRRLGVQPPGSETPTPDVELSSPAIGN